MYQELLFYYTYRRQRMFVRNRPLRVWVEPTNSCNLRCKICPQSLEEFSEKGFMDVELMKKIAAELRSIRPKLVTLHLSGEPLLHPKIAEFVRVVKKQDLNVTFSTNGLLLNRPMTEELIEAGLDDLRIDFAASKEKYEYIRQKAIWDVVFNNILNLLEIKKEKNLLKPRVLLINIDITDDQEKTAYNLNKLKGLFKCYKIEIMNLQLHSWAGEFAQRAKENSFFKRVLILKDDKSRYFPCHHIFGSFAITWNGDVVPCCRDVKKDYVIGNIKEHSIMELWNSERLVELRRKQALKQFNDIPLCRECTQLWTTHSLSKLVKNSFQKFLYLKFGHSLSMRKNKSFL